MSAQQRKEFRDGLQAFQDVETVAGGLGPIFDATSCMACHSVPTVGGSSPLVETRAARVMNGQYRRAEAYRKYPRSYRRPRRMRSPVSSRPTTARRRTAAKG